MKDSQETLPVKVQASDIQNKIKSTTYTLLPDGRTTVCQITLKNGFTVNGSSACVVKEEYNQALGEKYAFEKAFDNIWELEGYLLAEKRFQAGLVNINQPTELA